MISGVFQLIFLWPRPLSVISFTQLNLVNLCICSSGSVCISQTGCFGFVVLRVSQLLESSHGTSDVTTMAAENRLAFRIQLRPQVPWLSENHCIIEHQSLKPSLMKQYVCLSCIWQYKNNSKRKFTHLWQSPPECMFLNVSHKKKFLQSDFKWTLQVPKQEKTKTQKKL